MEITTKLEQKIVLTILILVDMINLISKYEINLVNWMWLSSTLIVGALGLF